MEYGRGVERDWSDQFALSDFPETLTQQSGKEEADINVLVKRFGVTGIMPQNVRVPVYSDFTDSITDYHSAMNILVQTRESFMAMPADVRSRFANDPQKFLEFCSNPENLPEMRKLGLAVPAADAPVEDPPKEPAPAG